MICDVCRADVHPDQFAPWQPGYVCYACDFDLHRKELAQAEALAKTTRVEYDPDNGSPYD